MSSIESWASRFPAMGLCLFLVGMVLAAGGAAWELIRTVDALAGGSTEVTATVTAVRALVSIGDPLMFNGVILYVAGRMMTAWSASVVALQQGPGSNLRVKGPDASNTVWIGRMYDSAIKAEDGAMRLRERLKARLVQS